MLHQVQGALLHQRLRQARRTAKPARLSDTSITSRTPASKGGTSRSAASSIRGDRFPSNFAISTSRPTCFRMPSIGTRSNGRVELRQSFRRRLADDRRPLVPPRRLYGRAPTAACSSPTGTTSGPITSIPRTIGTARTGASTKSWPTARSRSRAWTLPSYPACSSWNYSRIATPGTSPRARLLLAERRDTSVFPKPAPMRSSRTIRHWPAIVVGLVRVRGT